MKEWVPLQGPTVHATRRFSHFLGKKVTEYHPRINDTLVFGGVVPARIIDVSFLPSLHEGDWVCLEMSIS